jgi:transposase, IS5 family
MGHAKADKPQEKESKRRRSRDGTLTKKVGKLYFWYKLYSIIESDYDLIRNSITTASLYYLD